MPHASSLSGSPQEEPKNSLLDRFRLVLGDAIVYLVHKGHERDALVYREVLESLPPRSGLSFCEYKIRRTRCAEGLLGCIELAQRER